MWQADSGQGQRWSRCVRGASGNQHNQAETQGGVENTGLIGKLLADVNIEVAGLDVIMNNKYTLQPEKLRAWQSAGRVERAPQREKKSVVAIPGNSAGPSAKAA